MIIKRHAFKRMVSRMGTVSPRIIEELKDVFLLGNFKSFNEELGTMAYRYNGMVYVFNIQRTVLITVWRDK